MSGLKTGLGLFYGVSFAMLARELFFEFGPLGKINFSMPSTSLSLIELQDGFWSFEGVGLFGAGVCLSLKASRSAFMALSRSMMAYCSLTKLAYIMMVSSSSSAFLIVEDSFFSLF